MGVKRPWRGRVIPFSRDYRRAPRWGMGLPPKQHRRWWQKLIDPQVYLRLVIVLSGLALFVIPMLADGTLAMVRPITNGAEYCRIMHVVDGDTADMWCNATGFERVRLVGFDAPELFSPKCASELIAAQKSKWALRGYLFGTADLRMQRGKLDRYDRRLVTLWLGAKPLSQIRSEERRVGKEC